MMITFQALAEVAKKRETPGLLIALDDSELTNQIVESTEETSGEQLYRTREVWTESGRKVAETSV